MEHNTPDDGISRIEICGEFDPHTAEALQLELRRLARRHGVEVTSLTVTKGAGE